VRMSGQDVQRGTFTQRHAVLFDNETGKPWIPIKSTIVWAPLMKSPNCASHTVRASGRSTE
jgi:2-oxoglutarate dehydrogenase complex dehydrogenase (E1) component-like enzyme